MMPVWLAFVLVGIVGGGIIWWAYRELAHGVKHL
jgi:hypothetical protein